MGLTEHIDGLDDAMQHTLATGVMASERLRDASTESHGCRSSADTSKHFSPFTTTALPMTCLDIYGTARMTPLFGDRTLFCALA